MVSDIVCFPNFNYVIWRLFKFLKFLIVDQNVLLRPSEGEKAATCVVLELRTRQGVLLVVECVGGEQWQGFAESPRRIHNRVPCRLRGMCCNKDAWRRISSLRVNRGRGDSSGVRTFFLRLVHI